ncbi:hypothetical protein DM02DRAFT_643180 [Periconia macrospinosa]|uniref:Microbial-type PARG catalytic domain-containing protein n=1 Tax=Periconia macrospinosa TaxID=97972 RepID=A0A2V1DLV1_9PLEO|nr:hypothetical protein DM02DRAFT_643180 [Periconia macrospinosa]
MGRTHQSQGLAPPSVRKEQRAKLARHIVNKTVPAILASNTRARRGAEGSELVVVRFSDGDISSVVPNSESSVPATKGGATPNRIPEPQYIKRKGQGRRKAKNTTIDNPNSPQTHVDNHNATPTPDRLEAQRSIPARTIRIIAADTLVAAHLLKNTSKMSRKEPNICILNMASPLRPGGGVLAGATSQEESLCIRTTLLPSLKDSFYRLPEYGGIFSRDVLVFGSPEGELASADRYFVDVISAGMLRFPDLLGEEGEEKRLSKKDAKIVERKMRAVLRIASSFGVKKLILGAWGCGAYGNPVNDIAEAWQRVLGGVNDGHGRKSSNEPVESWDSVSEVVFAISSRKIAEAFGEAFRIEIEYLQGGHSEDESDHHSDQAVGELRSKIQEMEDQLGKVWNPDLKQRMGAILDGLRSQLRERESHFGAQQNEDATKRIVESMVGCSWDGNF